MQTTDNDVKEVKRLSRHEIFNPNNLGTDEIVRIGVEYAESDSWHGNQYFTTMLLVSEIERLRDEVEMAFQRGVDMGSEIEEFETNCELYDALDAYD